MKKYKFKFLSLIMAFIFCFSSLSVYAAEWTKTQKADYFWNNFDKLLVNSIGVCTGTASTEVIFHNFEELLYKNYLQDRLTYDEWLDNKFNINDSGDISLDVELVNVMKQATQEYIDSTGYTYVYSYGLQEFALQFNDLDRYNSIKNVLSENNFICRHSNFSDVNSFVYSYGSLENINLVAKSLNEYNGARPDCMLYDSDWNRINNIYSNDNGSISGPYNDTFDNTVKKDKSNVPNATYTGYFITLEPMVFKLYSDLDTFKADTLGISPYYITDSYNTNSSITGSYNTTTSAIDNSITYGAVTDYVNNYYSTNNSYPSTTNIYNYINNYVPPDPTPSPTPSVPDTDDDSGSIGGIWDWLDNLGKVLGDLIKHLGNALTAVADGIMEVIGTITVSLPNAFNNLLELLLGWLPPELRALISLSITAMVVYGIVKLIRG